MPIYQCAEILVFCQEIAEPVITEGRAATIAPDTTGNVMHGLGLTVTPHNLSTNTKQLDKLGRSVINPLNKTIRSSGPGGCLAQTRQLIP